MLFAFNALDDIADDKENPLDRLVRCGVLGVLGLPS